MGSDSAVVICSGGMDSVTLAYYARTYMDFKDLHLVSFNYGQRHVKELDFVAYHATVLKAKTSLIDITDVGKHLKGSALTDESIPVPHGHYAASNMKLTIVPNRNAIMLSCAWGIMVSEDRSALLTAVHAGDHAIYPDCRPEFLRAMNFALRAATTGMRETSAILLSPFAYKTKDEIVAMGASLKVNYIMTWSCYEGGKKHCGKCGTCVERKEAFRKAHVFDPTEYEDPFFEISAYVRGRP